MCLSDGPTWQRNLPKVRFLFQDMVIIGFLSCSCCHEGNLDLGSVHLQKSFLLFIYSCIQHFLNLQKFTYLLYHINSVIYIIAVEIKIQRDNQISQDWPQSICVGCQDSMPLACHLSLHYMSYLLIFNPVVHFKLV